MPDPSNGYEELAATFIRDRFPGTGRAVVRTWAGSVPPGAEVLELGCGHGVITEVLIESGLTVSVVDASPSLLHAFHQRFPHVPSECAAAEESNFFGRTFDGVIAIGLLFLLTERAQRTVLRKAARVLRPGGRLLFTAPHQQVEWIDILTHQPSRSLGAPVYESILREQHLQVSWGITDEAENHYFLVTKPSLQFPQHGPNAKARNAIATPIQCHPERSEGSAVAFGSPSWRYFQVAHNSTGTFNLSVESSQSVRLMLLQRTPTDEWLSSLGPWFQAGSAPRLSSRASDLHVLVHGHISIHS